MAPTDGEPGPGADHAHAHHGPADSGFRRLGGGPECTLCPICVLLQALTTSRPEVTQHLLSAGRELALALTAALEQHAEATHRSKERLQHIRVE